MPKYIIRILIVSDSTTLNSSYFYVAYLFNLRFFLLTSTFENFYINKMQYYFECFEYILVGGKKSQK